MSHIHTLADEQIKAIKAKLKKIYNEFEDTANPGFPGFGTFRAISQQPVIAPEK